LVEATGRAGDDEAMLRDVLAGLRAPRKQISSKYHYDERGSALFEEITRLEEYYPTRTERGLLERWMPDWVSELRPAALVELGAGSAEKSRIVLDAMVAAGSGATYVPVDVSDAFLRDTARQLGPEYPTLDVVPLVADITEPLDLPEGLPQPSWIAFLGSTLGNFDKVGTVDLLRRLRARMRPDDRFLLGVDLGPGPHKPVEVIERAYNDEAGVTERFSLNVLSVLNHEIGTDFDPDRFRHRSFYDEEHGRIETYLVSVGEQTVGFPDGSEIRFADGEAVRTEISSKYDRATVDELFAASGLTVDRWIQDELGYYALVLGKVAGESTTR
jgi:L-histidine N-alpha-methyltransferase